MPAYRYFSDTPLKKEQSIVIDGDEAHHLIHVMRCSKEDEIEIVNGKGTLAIGRVAGIKKKQAEILIRQTTFVERSSSHIQLKIGVQKSKAMEWVIEKGTELGVDSFHFFPAERSVKEELSENRKRRLLLIAVGAMKQSGRLYLPTIEQNDKIETWSQLADLTLYGEVNSSAPCAIDILEQKKSDRVSWVIGPEKGLSENEINQLLELGAIGVSLNKNILRTETACIAAAAISAQRR